MRLLENDIMEIYMDDEDTFIPNHEKIAIEHNRNEFIFLCIDVGILNLGLSLISTDFDYNFKNIVGVDLVDITKFNCDKNCKLKHDKICVDWINHFLQKYNQAFEECNHIIIERQPPSGLVVIEQLIMSKYRDKTTLVHPCSMHKYFHINTFDYEERKYYTEKISNKYIKNKDVIEYYNSFSRKHDIADSICLGLFWLNNIKIEFDKYQAGFNLIKKFDNLNVNDFFKSFILK